MSTINADDKIFEIFSWNRNFETGIDIIDEQHKTLVGIVNQLAWHVACETSELSCDQVLDELQEYAAFHFTTEEEIWREVLQEHATAEDHQQSHERFFEQLLSFRSAGAAEEQNLMQLLNYLTQWLAYHVLESDRRMAMMVKAVRQGVHVDEAQLLAEKGINGSVAVVVSALTEVYGKLSANTIQLMREKMARSRVEDELARLEKERIHQALEKQAMDYQQQLEFLAYYDSLTGLLNRNGIIREVRAMLEHEQLAAGACALISIDLDNFYNLNDRLGEESANILLGILGRRWRKVLRPGGALSRVSGDEFVVLVKDSQQVQKQLEVLQQVAGQPCELSGRTVTLSFTAGVVFFPSDGSNDADTLLRQADHTLFRAKQEAKGSWLFMDSSEHKQYRERQQLLEEIARALAEDQFRLVYQPKVNLCTGELIGVEALIRWQHPQQGLLAPGAFLPAIEHHGVIIDIGEWVITEALQQMRRWDEEGLNVSVGVNIAALHLQDDAFMARLRSLIGRFPDIDPGRLDLEILETAALGELDKATEIIRQCAELGVSFSLDDFGTGYSSLAYLKQLPVKTLKIDQEFVRGALENAGDISILKGIIGLSQAFGRCLVAEGLETLEHGNVLLELGCDVAQGYAIARPMPAAELAAWKDAWRPPEQWRLACYRLDGITR